MTTFYKNKIKNEQTEKIKRYAKTLGFEYVGVSKAEKLDKEARLLEEWLNQNYHGEMAYMANHFDKRIDPTQLVEGAKSVITLLYNYHNPATQEDTAAPKISQYAYGQDYHNVIKDKLRALLDFIRTEIGEVSGRCFVDSAPVMERTWAERSGTGWIGKNSLLITKQSGSYFFLSEIILDLELTADSPIKDYCGTCNRCIEACPTQAIVENKIIDAKKCISYLTIELKTAIPDEFHGKMDNWMFGCDVCQTVCPWNRFSKRHQEPKFEPHPDLLGMKQSDWTELTEEVFRIIFKHSAVKRAKFVGLKRNIEATKK